MDDEVSFSYMEEEIEIPDTRFSYTIFEKYLRDDIISDDSSSQGTSYAETLYHLSRFVHGDIFELVIVKKFLDALRIASIDGDIFFSFDKELQFFETFDRNLRYIEFFTSFD